MQAHNIGVKWIVCDVEGCEHKCKTNCTMKEHLQNVHDIGDYTCEYCAKNRKSSISYTDKKTNTTSNICRECYNRASGQKVRKEIEWSRYIDLHFGTDYLLSNDRSLKSQGGCQLLRPDKMYNCPNLTLILECDEHQHIYNNGSYTCEEKRLSDVYDEPGISGKFMAVIRYNPDTYQAADGKKRLKKSDRLQLMVQTMQWVVCNYEQVMGSPVHVFYIGYNTDNAKLCKNFPITMIHSVDDLSIENARLHFT